ncbi:NAD-dependent epimerase/dehydratase family protein [Candidatus Uhrbacteria bacterium]|nr:NAD-dependent epimerase/dehydratase family protein [Candidatus Uhrbacteria bacterium]
MKVLVTGGAGFIGSHLVDRLIDDGHEVIVIDHHKREKRRFPNAAATTHKVGFADEAAMEAVFKKEKPDAVCHLAAQISVTKSIEDPVADAQTNIVDAIALLDMARRHGCNKIVFSSSGGAIYGDHGIHPTPEIMNAQPISPYGIGKQAMEHYLELYSKAHGMQGVSLRFANIYGPRQQLSGGEGGVVPIFLDKILSGDPVTIFGDGSMTRDYLFVHDAVDAFVRALESDVSAAVNVSTGREVSVLELWNMVQDVHGKKQEPNFAPFRTGEVQHSVLAPNSAKDILGWEPMTTFEEGLAKTYKWFRDLES